MYQGGKLMIARVYSYHILSIETVLLIVLRTVLFFIFGQNRTDLNKKVIIAK